MRKPATSVLTLAAAGCAVLAATVSPAAAAPSSSTLTFTRSLAAAPTSSLETTGSGRTFYLVFGNSRTLFGPEDDDLDEGVGSGRRSHCS